jgi:hypothetical protein
MTSRLEVTVNEDNSLRFFVDDEIELGGAVILAIWSYIISTDLMFEETDDGFTTIVRLLNGPKMQPAFSDISPEASSPAGGEPTHG